LEADAAMMISKSAAGPEHAESGWEHEVEVAVVAEFGRRDSDRSRRRCSASADPAAPVEPNCVSSGRVDSHVVFPPQRKLVAVVRSNDK
jgi:hypothetical protein